MRVVADCTDEVDATLMMERLRESCLDLLDPEEDGDTVAVTQLIPVELYDHLVPEETLNVLKRARNALIRTRITDCYDMAREFDIMIHHLAVKMNIAEATPYDYGRFTSLVDRILNKNEDPTE